MATVRITINGLDAFVRSPFAAKDVIKGMPERQWNAALKVWIIPSSDVEMLKAALEAEGFGVIVADDTPKPGDADAGELARLRIENMRLKARNAELKAEADAARASGGPSPWSRRGAGSSWADDMFRALGVELGDKAYKALSRALHPDVGGSTEQMQLLNVAHDKARKVA